MTSLKKAIAARPGSTVPTLVNAARPELSESRQVLCRTLELGICGTDREILQSGQPEAPEGEQFLVLGHEALARVEAIGDDVDELDVDDLVVPVVRRPLP